MNETSNLQDNATGGNTITGNPQNIGSQSINQAQGNLQTNNFNLLGGSQGATIVDQNGQPISATQTSTQVQSQPTNHHKTGPVLVISAILIFVIIISTWLMNRGSTFNRKT